MLSWRWSGAILGAALTAGWAFVSISRPRHENGVNAAPQPPTGTGLVLVGYLEATGIDLARCKVRCTSMRLESNPIVHEAELDPRGRFEFTALADVDYCVEVVARANPALVLARMEHVRPGGDELVILPDPVRVFGPAASTERDSQ